MHALLVSYGNVNLTTAYKDMVEQGNICPCIKAVVLIYRNSMTTALLKMCILIMNLVASYIE